MWAGSVSEVFPARNVATCAGAVALAVARVKAAGSPWQSLLDLMPDWPFYVLIEIVLVTGIWALLTWAFVRPRQPAAASA